MLNKIKTHKRHDPKKYREERDAKWDHNFLLLKEYIAIFGHMRISDNYNTWELTLKFRGLKRWVCKQREYEKKGNLPLERQLQLDKIGFSFSPELDHWLERYNELSEYKKEHGTCVIYYIGSNKLIGLHSWAYNQRKIRHNLSEFQRAKLDELDFNWNKKDERWYKNFDKLKEYKKKYGHCNVPYHSKDIKSPPEIKKLGRFVAFQRKQYSKGKLKNEFFNVLKELGFEFDIMDRNWERQLEKLIEYKNEYGDCNVPDKWKINYPLSCWVRSQRSEKEIIPPERRKILDEIGFIWDVREYNFNKNYELLKQFYEKNGHCRIPRNENEQLFLWINSIRQVKRDKFTRKLTANQIDKLNKIGLDWVPNDTIWEAGFQIFKDYKLKYGNIEYRYCHLGKKLWRWINKQRKDKEIMSSDKKERLDEIGFVW
jgi:hypothetical protein